MCLVYYLGSDSDVPLTKKWTAEAPGFYVSVPDESEMKVSRHLDFPCIRYLGSHQGCGCGFRTSGDGMTDEFETADKDSQRDHEALTACLNALPPQSRPRQIYGCWSGDEALPVEHFRACAVLELADPRFAFRERELITLTI